MAVLRGMKRVKEETYGKEVFLRSLPDPLQADPTENKQRQLPCIDRTAVPFGRSMDRKHAELSQPPDSLPGQSGPTRSPIIRRLNWSALGRKVS